MTKPKTLKPRRKSSSKSRSRSSEIEELKKALENKLYSHSSPPKGMAKIKYIYI